MLKQLITAAVFFVIFGGTQTSFPELPFVSIVNCTRDSIPSTIHGNFTDDYGIRYTINDTLWTQLPNVKYHIISCNIREQYLLTRNDNANPGEKGLYTRIDYMNFSNMEPFQWGFCLTVYNAVTLEEALAKAKADRQNPRKGCGGYPFSRMRRID